MTITPVADAYEQHLRVEIASDTPHKIEAARKAICDLILDIPADHDVMVAIHDIPVETDSEHGR